MIGGPYQALLKQHMRAGYSGRLRWRARTPLRCARGPHLRESMQALHRLLTPWQAAHARSSGAHGRGVNAHDAVFVLNPSGDLAHTQDTFQGLFEQQPGWQVKPVAPAWFCDLHMPRSI